MLLRPSRLAVAVARADHHDVLVLRNELNEHIRPGMLVWGVSKFSAEKKMKEQPSFYAFFIRKMVAPTGDPKEIVVEGEWLHALEYLRRLDKKNVIGDKWQGHNVWFFTKQRQNLEADAVVSVVSAVPVRVNADGVLIDARSGVLYVAGHFGRAGGAPVEGGVAAWDGARWRVPRRVATASTARPMELLLGAGLLYARDSDGGVLRHAGDGWEALPPLPRQVHAATGLAWAEGRLVASGECVQYEHGAVNRKPCPCAPVSTHCAWQYGENRLLMPHTLLPHACMATS